MCDCECSWPIKHPPTTGIVVMSICDANNSCHKFTSGATITKESLVGNIAIKLIS